MNEMNYKPPLTFDVHLVDFPLNLTVFLHRSSVFVHLLSVTLTQLFSSRTFVLYLQVPFCMLMLHLRISTSIQENSISIYAFFY